MTGGSRGLGLEIAQALGEAGARVTIAARRQEWLEKAERKLLDRGVDVMAKGADVADHSAVTRLVEETERSFGRIDILVNAAGRTWGATPLEMPLEKWHEVMEANATGTFLACQAVGRGMIERRFGRIINIASVAGLQGTPPEVMDAVGYSASKGAIVALTRDLAVKWARYGVTVNALAPGFFPTRMSEKVIERARSELERWIPMRRVGRAGELGPAAVFLASNSASYITGQIIAVDGGLTAL